MKSTKFQNVFKENCKFKIFLLSILITGLSYGLYKGMLDNFLVEIVEFPNHPWAIGCQFHPEFKSRPNRPHPLFKAFLEAIYEFSKN